MRRHAAGSEAVDEAADEDGAGDDDDPPPRADEGDESDTGDDPGVCIDLFGNCLDDAETLQDVEACEALFDHCVDPGECPSCGGCPADVLDACVSTYASCISLADTPEKVALCEAAFDEQVGEPPRDRLEPGAAAARRGCASLTPEGWEDAQADFVRELVAAHSVELPPREQPEYSALASAVAGRDVNVYCWPVESWGPFDRALFDPPREGAIAVVKALPPDGAPRRIVYVSCNPATLARDAAVLVTERGYTLSAAGIVNMFPHTAHIESIAVFDR